MLNLLAESKLDRLSHKGGKYFNSEVSNKIRVLIIFNNNSDLIMASLIIEEEYGAMCDLKSAILNCFNFFNLT